MLITTNTARGRYGIKPNGETNIMTYLVKNRSHLHQWFIDSISGDKICLCGATRGINEKRKYHNHSMTYNGFIYHSQLEANYAAELDLRVRAGYSKLGAPSEVRPQDKNDYHIANYYIDFIVFIKTEHMNFERSRNGKGFVGNEVENT